MRDARRQGRHASSPAASASPTDGLAAGYFYAPTLLADVTPEMLIYREETFGPVAPVIVFDTTTRRSPWPTTPSTGWRVRVHPRCRAFRAVEALKFGMVGVNDINPRRAAAPFGGVKQSGLGSEGAREGIEAFLETKTIGIGL